MLGRIQLSDLEQIWKVRPLDLVSDSVDLARKLSDGPSLAASYSPVFACGSKGSERGIPIG